MKKKTIVSLFDYSGNWSKPFKENGFEVIQIDIKHGDDILEFFQEMIYLSVDNILCDVFGILAATPCTDFAVSGARHWKAKETKKANYTGKMIDNDVFENTVELSVLLVLIVLELVKILKPKKFWALENPVGRLGTLVPEIGKPWYFQPYWFGDPYTKKTGLWGKFNKPKPVNMVDPTEGSKMWRLYGGSSEKTKTARSVTPMGFAWAFYHANCGENMQLSLFKN